ncbi:flagellar assembly protein FliW [Clostridium sp. YIM B02515]|uniref:Flagellar assembly factor FliW n=1 Tax=Clostridium rhizosphaerae TaxID=2803861 RepID=A0ABS1TF65_9CLOT|nr:flagellar assembly protein FliW [Clostridium rhizosphaerae]MBL4938010.1 flagellar assembly protein FliW [Clostridium rhizosphaerae]
MKLNTKYHGVKEYKEEDVITFKKGLPGFEELKRYILFPAEENELFNILHSIENEELGLIVISPFELVKDYEFKLNDEKLKELKIISPEEVMVLNTVTLSSNIEHITTNLKAPIIINIKERLGEQIILDNEMYKIKHPLLKKEVKALNGL